MLEPRLGADARKIALLEKSSASRIEVPPDIDRARRLPAEQRAGEHG